MAQRALNSPAWGELVTAVVSDGKMLGKAEAALREDQKAESWREEKSESRGESRKLERKQKAQIGRRTETLSDGQSCPGRMQRSQQAHLHWVKLKPKGVLAQEDVPAGGYTPQVLQVFLCPSHPPRAKN